MAQVAFSLAREGTNPILCQWCSDTGSCIKCIECNALFCVDCDVVLHKPAAYRRHTRSVTAAHAPELVEKYDELSHSTPVPRPLSKKLRVYIDGCFDLMHSGHFNAIRQARALGDVLVVGVHSDAEITRHKGPPVMNENERYGLVEACKWVDELARDVPYSVSVALLDRLNCDFVVHGDDFVTNADGQDAYLDVKAKGRMRMVKRTEGVSTTDLVGRMLLMTKSHLRERSDSIGSDTGERAAEVRAAGISQFLPTTRRIIQFANGKAPKPTDHIVYVDGAWDLFHIGHVETLRKAKALGDFLIVGVHDDPTVNEHKGGNYPVMNLHERCLNVLSCKYVDEVIIGAPYVINRDLLTSMNIAVVVQGTTTRLAPHDEAVCDPYVLAKELNIYQEVPSTTDLCTEDIVQRIIDNRLRYLKRNEGKAAKEKAYLQNKEFVQEM
eukprot:GILK01001197.1.p1 GENE.GILK01001197.1~~GILK01001197.1.p1  ORF type:complete len:454 (+),score=70.73 GILK01001197.1:46-1362(+)